MLKLLRTLFGSNARPMIWPPLPEGERAYAIGDVHGCADLLVRLASKIESDDAIRPEARTTIIMLGDLIDRGPDSAGVVNFVLNWSKQRAIRTIAGNHEEMLLASFGSEVVLRRFLQFGGRETLVSYLGDAESYSSLSLEELFEQLPDIIPAQHIEFLQSLEDYVEIGDYLFVHAGIRPGIAPDEQRGTDLRWIREGFLDFEQDFGKIVVHGHTISESVEIRTNRIGVDTGAYRSGVLSAVGLEGTARWFLTS